MKMKLILTGIIVVASLFVLFTVINQSRHTGPPSFIKSSPKIEEAYMFAQSNPEVLNGVKCYCGCMQHLHDGRIHSRGLLDCFMREDGSFEKHGSECDMCINDALDVKKWNEEGVSKEEINEKIDSRYLNQEV